MAIYRLNVVLIDGDYEFDRDVLTSFAWAEAMVHDHVIEYCYEQKNIVASCSALLLVHSLLA